LALVWGSGVPKPNTLLQPLLNVKCAWLICRLAMATGQFRFEGSARPLINHSAVESYRLRVLWPKSLLNCRFTFFFYVPGPDVELESSPGKQVYNERFLLHSHGCAGVGNFINVLPWPCTWKCI